MSSEELESFLSHKFTHIVVGGGTAGLVVAARLSENPTITVGILEAGPAAFDDPRINVPGRFGETLFTELDWQFETIPQPGLGGRSIPFNRGKVLGGSSALNFMTWNRGCKEDYDAWEELGNEGWGWNGLLLYFKKSENFHAPNAEHQAQHQSHFTPDYHGTGGPLQTTYSTTYGASHQHWHATMHKLGIQMNRSHFSGSNVGCWTSLTGVTPERRERCYSATAYYKPASGRSNLVLLTEAIAEEVVLEKEGEEWVAKGVRFTHKGREHVVRTEGEVVVCGGSVSSPQLLELSGIGNPEILKAAGIECKVDNPNVGENLQEHIMTAMIFEISPSIVTPEDLRADPVLAAAADKEYLLDHAGPRTAIPSSVAYLPFTHIVPSSTLQEMGSTLLSASNTLEDKILVQRLLTDQNLGQIEYNFDISNYNPYFKSEPGKKYATMLMMLQYPFSKGSIHIPAVKADGNQKPRATAADKPVIDPKYYEGKGGAIDFDLMVHCQQYADRICRTQPLSSIIEKRVFPPAATSTTTNGTPNSTTNSRTPTNSTTNTTTPNNPPQTDPPYDFSPWVRDTTITDWHPVGTCAMGGRGGIRTGVVDARLRVYGTRGLRVVDASVMPLQIAAHLQATVYAIGEKGGEIIGGEWVG